MPEYYNKEVKSIPTKEYKSTSTKERKSAPIKEYKQTRNGKGDKPRKGANLLKFRKNFDQINWKSKKIK